MSYHSDHLLDVTMFELQSNIKCIQILFEHRFESFPNLLHFPKIKVQLKVEVTQIRWKNENQRVQR